MEALVVVADLVVVLVPVVVGMVFWHVALLQYPVIFPLMHGTPCFLRTEVSQTKEEVHLGLLLHGPILRPQICPTLILWHCINFPGALQHIPPSQVSPISIFPLPQIAPAWDMVEVKVGETELERVMDPDPETEKD